MTSAGACRRWATPNCGWGRTRLVARKPQVVKGCVRIIRSKKAPHFDRPISHPKLDQALASKSDRALWPIELNKHAEGVMNHGKAQCFLLLQKYFYMVLPCHIVPGRARRSRSPWHEGVCDGGRAERKGLKAAREIRPWHRQWGQWRQRPWHCQWRRPK